MLDYKQGQLDQLKSQLPPEVHEAVEKAGKLLADFLVKVKAFNTQVLLKAEELSAKIQIGDKTLADYIFNAKQQKVNMMGCFVLLPIFIGFMMHC